MQSQLASEPMSYAISQIAETSKDERPSSWLHKSKKSTH